MDPMTSNLPDWNDSEAVVRWAGGASLFDGGIGDGTRIGEFGRPYWGETWESARQHPTVQALERQHNPAFAQPAAEVESPNARAGFEEFLRAEGWHVEYRDDGSYYERDTNLWWRIWQAAWKGATQ